MRTGQISRRLGFGLVAALGIGVAGCGHHNNNSSTTTTNTTMNTVATTPSSHFGSTFNNDFVQGSTATPANVSNTDLTSPDPTAQPTNVQ